MKIATRETRRTCDTRGAQCWIPCALAYFFCHLTASRIKDYLQAPSYFVLGWREFFQQFLAINASFIRYLRQRLYDFRHAHNLSPTVCLSARTADQEIFSPRKSYLYLTKSFTVKIWFINEFSRITTVKDLWRFERYLFVRANFTFRSDDPLLL